MYRILPNTPHPRTGSEAKQAVWHVACAMDMFTDMTKPVCRQWPIYPSYDWAHGLSDAIEAGIVVLQARDKLVVAASMPACLCCCPFRESRIPFVRWNSTCTTTLRCLHVNLFVSRH